MTLWTRRLSIVVALALVATAIPYLVAWLSALWNGGFVLTYQTDMTSRFSYSEHILISRLLYGLLSFSILVAALTLERPRYVALTALLIAAPIMLNDRAGAVFDFFAAMPWAPKSGPAFERFYNELRVPVCVWYVLLATIALSMLHCASSIARRDGRARQGLIGGQ
jgi:hypothetical protein